MLSRLNRYVFKLFIVFTLVLSAPTKADFTIGQDFYEVVLGSLPSNVRTLLVDSIALPNRLIGIQNTGEQYNISPLIRSIIVKPVKRYFQKREIIPEDMIRIAKVAYGSKDIQSAYFVNTNTQYLSRVLGTSIISRTLKIVKSNGQVLSHTLSQDEIFEDTQPNIIDLRDDGYAEVLATIRSINGGASIGLFIPIDNELRLVARTAPTDRSNWISTIGAADFDSDNKTEIAVVNSPESAGYLEFYEMERGEFDLQNRFYGFSNHVIGTSYENVARIHDMNQDGQPDIIIASNDLQTLQSIGFNRNGIEWIFRQNFKQRIQSDLYFLFGDKNQKELLQIGFLLSGSNVGMISREAKK